MYDNPSANKVILFNSLPPGWCDCDFKCVNLKHNFGIDILSIEVKIPW